MSRIRSRRLGTLAGSVAIVLWSMLAVMTTAARGIPPFQLLSLTFAVAFVLGLVIVGRQGRDGFSKLRQRPAAWLLGIGGLFGYHALYFIALGNAPAVEASLIAYLWPLLIVLFSAFLPGEALRWYHVAGALLGLSGAVVLLTGGGAVVLLTGGGAVGFRAEHGFGYLAALACAFTWSIYSVLNRRFSDVPTEAVSGFCGATALLAILCHRLFESWVSPTPGQWMAIVILGLAPVGAAFFVWDFGTKHGDIRVLGALSYATPLMSTILLIIVGEAEATWVVAVACLLIVSGAMLASKDLFAPKPQNPSAVP